MAVIGGVLLSCMVFLILEYIRLAQRVQKLRHEVAYLDTVQHGLRAELSDLRRSKASVEVAPNPEALAQAEQGLVKIVHDLTTKPIPRF